MFGGGDNQTSANVVLTSDTSQYQQAMAQAAQSTNQVGVAYQQTQQKVQQGFRQRVENGLSSIAKSDTVAFGVATAAAARYQSVMSGLQAQSNVLNQTFGNGKQRMDAYRASVDSLRSSFGMTDSAAANLVQTISGFENSGSTQGLTNLAKTFENMSRATGENAAALAQSVLTLDQAMGNGLSTAKSYADQLTTMAAISNTNAESLANFASQIAPLGRQLNMTQSDVVGFASAFSKAGQDGYRAANVFSSMTSQIAQAIQTNSPILKEYANLMGVTVATFKSMSGTQQTAGIFDAVNRQGTGAITTLNRLGFDGVTTQRVISAVVQQSGGVQNMINQANRARGNGSSTQGEETLGQASMRFGQVGQRFAEAMGQWLVGPVTMATNILSSFGDVIIKITNSPIGVAAQAILGATAAVVAFAAGAVKVAAPLATIMTLLSVRNFASVQGIREGIMGAGALGGEAMGKWGATYFANTDRPWAARHYGVGQRIGAGLRNAFGFIGRYDPEAEGSFGRQMLGNTASVARRGFGLAKDFYFTPMFQGAFQPDATKRDPFLVRTLPGGSMMRNAWRRTFGQGTDMALDAATAAEVGETHVHTPSWRQRMGGMFGGGASMGQSAATQEMTLAEKAAAAAGQRFGVVIQFLGEQFDKLTASVSGLSAAILKNTAAETGEATAASKTSEQLALFGADLKVESDTLTKSAVTAAAAMNDAAASAEVLAAAEKKAAASSAMGGGGLGGLGGGATGEAETVAATGAEKGLLGRAMGGLGAGLAGAGELATGPVGWALMAATMGPSLLRMLGMGGAADSLQGTRSANWMPSTPSSGVAFGTGLSFTLPGVSDAMHPGTHVMNPNAPTAQDYYAASQNADFQNSSANGIKTTQQAAALYGPYWNKLTESEKASIATDLMNPQALGGQYNQFLKLMNSGQYNSLTSGGVQALAGTPGGLQTAAAMAFQQNGLNLVHPFAANVSAMGNLFGTPEGDATMQGHVGLLSGEGLFSGVGGIAGTLGTIGDIAKGLNLWGAGKHISSALNTAANWVTKPMDWLHEHTGLGWSNGSSSSNGDAVKHVSGSDWGGWLPYGGGDVSYSLGDSGLQMAKAMGLTTSGQQGDLAKILYNLKPGLKGNDKMIATLMGLAGVGNGADLETALSAMGAQQITGNAKSDLAAALKEFNMHSSKELASAFDGFSKNVRDNVANIDVQDQNNPLYGATLLKNASLTKLGGLYDKGVDQNTVMATLQLKQQQQQLNRPYMTESQYLFGTNTPNAQGLNNAAAGSSLYSLKNFWDARVANESKNGGTPDSQTLQAQTEATTAYVQELNSAVASIKQYNMTLQQNAFSRFQFDEQLGWQRKQEQLQVERQDQSFQIQRSRSEFDYNLQRKRSEADYNLQRSRAQQDFAHQTSVMIKQASLSMMNIYQQNPVQGLTSAQFLLYNNSNQTSLLNRQESQLTQLRKQGLTTNSIQQLGLTDANNNQELNSLFAQIQQNPALIDQLNSAVQQRLTAAGALATDASSMTYQEQSYQFKISMDRSAADFTKSMKRSDEDFTRSLQRSVDDFDRQMKWAATDFNTQVSHSTTQFNQSMYESVKMLNEAQAPISNVGQYLRTAAAQSGPIGQIAKSLLQAASTNPDIAQALHMYKLANQETAQLATKLQKIFNQVKSIQLGGTPAPLGAAPGSGLMGLLGAGAGPSSLPAPIRSRMNSMQPVSGNCLSDVETALGANHVGGSAFSEWNALQGHRHALSSNMPIGVPIFFGAPYGKNKRTGQIDGHVALNAGGGMMWSEDANNAWELKPIWGGALGWADELGGVSTVPKGFIPGRAFAQGAWNLSADQLAGVHKGEMIIPAKIAAAVRSVISKGTAQNLRTYSSPVHIGTQYVSHSSSVDHSMNVTGDIQVIGVQDPKAMAREMKQQARLKALVR